MEACSEKTPSLTGISLLCVDDDPSILRSLMRVFTALGARVEGASSLSEAASLLTPAYTFSAVIADLRLRDGSGLDLLAHYQQCSPQGAFYVLTGHATVANAVDAVRNGVTDYFEKPIDPLALAQRLREDLSAGIAPQGGLVNLLEPYLEVRDLSMISALADIPAFAESDETLLIQGETGTGKELISRAVHGLGPRKQGPFVAVNCGAIPKSMLEAELFGFERGAFTGASKKHLGYFEQANRGTLFLDEVGEMPMSAQAGLLRVLEDGVVRRLGGEKEHVVDVRVVAATHRALEEHANGGLFREDLLFRINALEIKLPPLRHRPKDIRYLAQHFINQSLSSRPVIPRLSPVASDRLCEYTWPGNVRELRNIMVRLAVKLPADLAEISPDWIESLLPEPREKSVLAMREEGVFIPKGTTLADAEWRIIDAALRQSGFNRTKAAELLGISVRTLRRKLNSE